MTTIKQTFSFSLVELMVALAIIGALAAIAIPNYKIYLIRSKVAAGIPVLTAALDNALQIKELKDAYPNPLNSYNVSITAGQAVAVTMSPIVGMHYNIATNSGAAWVCVYFADLGIPNYVAWSGGPNTGTNARLCLLAALENNTYNKYCGYFNGYTTDIAYNSKKYAPDTCNNNLSIYNY